MRIKKALGRRSLIRIKNGLVIISITTESLIETSNTATILFSGGPGHALDMNLQDPQPAHAGAHLIPPAFVKVDLWLSCTNSCC